MRNVPFMLAFGILSYNRIKDVPHLSVARWEVQERRRSLIPVTGKPVHDYVPLYIATHTPMQYVIVTPSPQKARQPVVTQDDLVFLEVSATGALRTQGVLFANGNAASVHTTFHTDPAALIDFDWNSIFLPNAYPHCYDREWKRKKSAEILLPDRVAPELISRVVVHSDSAKQRLVDSIKLDLTKSDWPDRDLSAFDRLNPIIDTSHYF
jgi:hypothetical protein